MLLTVPVLGSDVAFYPEVHVKNVTAPADVVVEETDEADRALQLVFAVGICNFSPLMG